MTTEEILKNLEEVSHFMSTNLIGEINNESLRRSVTDRYLSYFSPLKQSGSIVQYMIQCDEHNNNNRVIDANGYQVNLHITFPTGEKYYINTGIVPTGFFFRTAHYKIG